MIIVWIYDKLANNSITYQESILIIWNSSFKGLPFDSPFKRYTVKWMQDIFYIKSFRPVRTSDTADKI